MRNTNIKDHIEHWQLNDICGVCVCVYRMLSCPVLCAYIIPRHIRIKFKALNKRLNVSHFAQITELTIPFVWQNTVVKSERKRE